MAPWMTGPDEVLTVVMLVLVTSATARLMVMLQPLGRAAAPDANG